MELGYENRPGKIKAPPCFAYKDDICLSRYEFNVTVLVHFYSIEALS